ncbi:F0F1 ATP synthase subunit A [Chlorobaculum thiosulfatiphilum]|jgi:F-type H+-transporting ATPase subunit a|uniref:ATP synthase subunit a n=1 Tax=Chlorobaculum thiosulfatiphilum TaxID=115852 RepID=A0A5C4S8X0_CHLTI|nr:F0F1 ATP synthase subunit A [Chlorobaculum thiosulfatiphilum]TNJ39578.1 F0F1 ATP synthase subunit A [Chlorobaculum thiosulfatiphilum]
MRKKAISRILALVVPVLLSLNSPVFATAGQNEAPVAATAPAAPASIEASAAAPAEAETAHAEGGEEKPGDLIMHHILDNHTFAFEPFGEVHLPRIEVAGYDISITKHVVMIWLAAILLVVIASAAGASVRKMSANQAPKGVANVFESLVDFISNDVAKPNIGHGYEKYLPYLLTVFFFILVCNLLGLIPYGATATGNVNVTLTLATFTFIVTQVSAFKAHGIKGYLQHLTAGTHWALWIIMVPIEILGQFTKPFALTIRLFANMTAGHIIILSLFFISFILKSYIVAVAVSIPFAIFIYLLELFVAFLQAFVFTMLSALFIGLATAHEGGHDGHELEASGHH